MGKLWLIRHAETYYNEHCTQWNRLGCPVNKNFQFEERFMDSILTNLGIQKSREMIPQIHSLDVQLVFVSPLRRALQTCDIIFKDHPNHPPIIVHPILHERFHNAHDVSVYEGTLFPEYSHFDWTLMNENPHFQPSLCDNEYIKQIVGLSYQETRMKLLEMMSAIDPNILESEAEIFRRGQKSKNIWRDYCRTQNVALVSHSGFIRYFTGRLDDSGNIIQGTQLPNCGILDYQDDL